ncbi:MAG: Cys-tRNA(Pro) deacylase [Deltaproteobacteria bacterium]|nr:Cys-tRNA(Pro) deacylase [Deltaproteobacteria bacterium]HCH62703.1 Cys-tRNA(Pro) deacylase [Deltaproteobacteria bacterium]
MARKPKIPRTPALRALDHTKVPYTIHPYEYVERGGTAASSAALGVDEHRVVKTLIFETDSKKPIIVCQHGDRSVSAKNLARIVGCKSTRPCDPSVAQRHSGYKVGGTSPFGTRKPMPIYVEESILALDHIYINGGGRGLLVKLSPAVLMALPNATAARITA